MFFVSKSVATDGGYYIDGFPRQIAKDLSDHELGKATLETLHSLRQGIPPEEIRIGNSVGEQAVIKLYPSYRAYVTDVAQCSVALDDKVIYIYPMKPIGRKGWEGTGDIIEVDSNDIEEIGKAVKEAFSLCPSQQ